MGPPNFNERMDALGQKLELVAQLHLEADRREQEHWERYRAEMAERDRKHDAQMAELAASGLKNQQDIQGMNRTLRRAIRLGVREARNQRQRMELLDGKITQLAAAQVVTEEYLQGLIETMRLGGNGHRS